jgi:hypothetical protein
MAGHKRDSGFFDTERNLGGIASEKIPKQKYKKLLHYLRILLGFKKLIWKSIYCIDILSNTITTRIKGSVYANAKVTLTHQFSLHVY